MATLIIEDGTGVAGANSYVTVAQADIYFANVNNTVWDGLDSIDQKGPFLIQAVRYMQQVYRSRWKGYRRYSLNLTSKTQILDWPRVWVDQIDSPGGYGPYPYFYDPNSIPQEIKDAQCELAVRAANGDLAPDIDRVEKSVQVGSLKVEYDPNYSPIVVFRAIEALLDPFFESQGTMSRIGRL